MFGIWKIGNWNLSRWKRIGTSFVIGNLELGILKNLDFVIWCFPLDFGNLNFKRFGAWNFILKNINQPINLVVATAS